MATQAGSFHKLMQVLYKKDAMNEWGSIVALSYMAAQRVFPDYNDMADNKAYLESIARSFGYFFGRDKKVRVNTISQSPTPTTASNHFINTQIGNIMVHSSILTPLRIWEIRIVKTQSYFY